MAELKHSSLRYELRVSTAGLPGGGASLPGWLWEAVCRLHGISGPILSQQASPLLILRALYNEQFIELITFSPSMGADNLGLRREVGHTGQVASYSHSLLSY